MKNQIKVYVGLALSLPILLVGYTNCSGDFAPKQVVSSSSASNGALVPAVPAASLATLEAKAMGLYKANACNACHGTAPGLGGIYLLDRAQLIANGSVVPGSPSTSNAYIHTDGNHKGVPAFAAADRQAISDWIVALAAPVATPTPAPTPIASGPVGSPVCTVTASMATNVVPGDMVTFTISWNGSPTAATFDGAAFNPVGMTTQTVTQPVLMARAYVATATNATGTGSCSVSIATKANAALTKDEFYRAKIGPLSSSVDDLLSINRCANCHGAVAPMIKPNSTAQNLAGLKAFSKGDLTKATSAINVYTQAAGHYSKNPAYNAAELTHIMNFINQP